MRKPEQRLWDTMLRRAPPRGIWLRRVENLVGVGDPDVEVLAQGGVASWVELKAPNAPVRASTPVLGEKEGLRPEQVSWHLKASSLGGRSYVLVRTVGRDGLWLLRGAAAAGLNSATAAELNELAVATDWPLIFQELMHP